MAEELDLDKAIQRDPNWISGEKADPIQRRNQEAGLLANPGAHDIDRISKLPRDRLIWLAMVIEMASQKMQAAEPKNVVLSEAVSLALPGLEKRNLPVPVTPNWSVKQLSLEEMFSSLRLSDWE